VNVFEIASSGSWINNWIERRAELTPNWLALMDDAVGDRRITFKEFNERASKVAGFLKYSLNVSKGDVVAMISWARIEVLEVLFACMKIGAVFVPVNVRLSASEIIDLLKDMDVKVLVYEDEFLDKVSGIVKGLGSVKTIVLGEKGLSDSIKFDDVYGKKLDKVTEVSLEDPIMILQTGGTTGKPKGGVVTYRMILWNAVNTVRDLIIPGDVTITAVPLFHIGGYTYTIPLLFWGGSNIIMRRWNVDKFIDLVERERPTFLFLVPTQIKMLIENERFWKADFSSVRWITSGGAALTRDLIETIFKKGIVQKQGYGLTEMGPGVFALDPWDAKRKIGSIGKPNLLVETKVVKEDGSIAERGEEGELLLRGPSLFGGYWRMDDETEKALEGGWLHTGDIVRIDDEGFYWIVGRRKHLIKSGAEAIYPEEIEKILLNHPKIEDVVVIGVPDEKWGEVPKALVVLKSGEKITKDEIVNYLIDKIAKYKIPKYIQVLKEIPKSPLGKVSRKELTKLYGEPIDKLEVN